MPYIDSKRIKEIRNTIKAKYPEFKFSVTGENHTSININILSGPIQMITNEQNKSRGYEQVNHFYIKENYKDFPEIRNILLDIYNIANEGNYTEVVDGDYGIVPSFYVNISIGKWDKPYTIIS